MNDNTTDKAMLLGLSIVLTLIGIYTKDAQIIGGSLVVIGYTARALASRVQVGEIK